MRQFVVIGLGTFGFNVAVELAKQGHQVLAIDSNKSIVEEIKNHVAEAVAASAMDKEALAELVGDNIDTAILGLGEPYMEATVLSILHLKSLGVKNIIVKSMNELRGKVYSAVGATEIIYPEKESALRLANKLSIPTLIDQIPLAPEYSIFEIVPPDSFAGRSIRDVNIRQKYGATIVAIKDILQDQLIIAPSADYIFMPDSALIVLGKQKDIEKLRRLK